jgi:hypothetical protein
MTDRMRKIIESKRGMRRQLAALPFARKLELLDELRGRSLLIAASPLRRKQPRQR